MPPEFSIMSSPDQRSSYDRAQLLRELSFEAVRSSGPGGQAVNKKSTKERLTWNPSKSKAFLPDVHARLMIAFEPRLTKAGEIILASDQFRERRQNHRFVTELFFAIIDQALIIPEERIATKPTRGSQLRRVEEKKRQAKKKDQRKSDWE